MPTPKDKQHKSKSKSKRPAPPQRQDAYYPAGSSAGQQSSEPSWAAQRYTPAPEPQYSVGQNPPAQSYTPTESVHSYSAGGHTPQGSPPPAATYADAMTAEPAQFTAPQRTATAYPSAGGWPAAQQYASDAYYSRGGQAASTALPLGITAIGETIQSGAAKAVGAGTSAVVGGVQIAEEVSSYRATGTANYLNATGGAFKVTGAAVQVYGESQGSPIAKGIGVSSMAVGEAFTAYAKPSTRHGKRSPDLEAGNHNSSHGSSHSSSHSSHRRRTGGSGGGNAAPGR